MMKKTMALIVSVFLVFCLAGCKQPGAEGNDSGDTKDNPESVKSYPVFTPAGGFYKSVQTLGITHADATAIYYTTDGTEPTVNSTRYTLPFSISSDCVVRALAIQSDGTKSYAQTAFDFDLDRTTDYSGTVLASPNWQDQVIYFLLTDRFCNGNVSNDNDNDSFDETASYTGQPESGFNGGDFAGIASKLSYIKNLGPTAIWITPPIKNQVTEGNYHGYHGYWASDFTETDSHFGTLAEYQDLVSTAHDDGLYVIQDIVVNHTGDYMKVSEKITPAMLANKPVSTNVFSLNQHSVPDTRPAQIPWKFNDPNNLTADELEYSSFYNFNPAITDYTDDTQLLTYQMSDLDDMNTGNPVVQNLLRGYFRYWIDKAGIDGYRIDTVMYVQPSFFEGFINSTESGNLGVREYAKTVGKNDFLDFGEAWSETESVVASYTYDKATKTPRIDSIIYFPLTFAIRSCLGSGTGTSMISSVLNRRYQLRTGYKDPNRLVTFIDNHDMDRLIKSTDPEMVKAAYAIIMTIPGVPQIYYGAEQGASVQRPALFAGGYECSADAYDETSEWYAFFKDIIALRKANEVFRYNRLSVLKSTDANAGILSYALVGRDKADDAVVLGEAAGTRALVVLNNSESEQVYNVTQSILSPGDRLVLKTPSSAGYPSELFVGSDGGISFIVPSKSFGIYLLDEVGGATGDRADSVTVTSTYSGTISENSITVTGETSQAGTMYLVKNSDYTNASSFVVSAGAFSRDCDITALSNGTNSVEFVLRLADGSFVYSKPVEFTIERPFVERVTVTDPVHDDTGPAGKNYGMPLTAIQPYDGQMDITGVVVKTSGSDICLEVSTRSMSMGWNPTVNLFDHAMFSVFLAKPGSTSGSSVHPMQNYTLPGGFAWDYMMKAEGWSTSYYSSINAAADCNGTALTPAPTSEVDWSGTAETSCSPGLIRFYIKGSSLGYPNSLEGWKVYINTYDYDTQKLRGLDQEPSEWKFSGGNMETDPLVIDETGIITISLQ